MGDFFVAPDGNDANAGSSAAPFASLAKARDSVRQRFGIRLSRNVLISIRGGFYPQTETLVFGPRDSGTFEHSITYAAAPGERVQLSGGKRISGWRKGTGEVWTTAIPEVKAGGWYFRQLFVGGRRAIRARTPNLDGKVSWWRISSSTANKDKPPADGEEITVKVSGPIHACRNPSDVELVYMQNNECGRKRLISMDEAAQTFNLATPNRGNPKEFVSDWVLSIPFAGKPCYLENALEMLDQPGEWYLDRKAGILHYWPRDGEDMRHIEVVAPDLQNTLLKVAGPRTILL